ncbi:MAG TPA: gamma-glutamylcyclotransferase family protein [Bryobacteraceae bacterium]|nr:gamma-glutamylcyclotransferase family protein [Bryobacteraceae bacterium]
MSVLLFAYGTLQDRNVQLAVFGRELRGREDALPGYVRRMARGQSHLATVELSSNPNDAVSGTVFRITEQELAVADRYEQPAAYSRICIALKSGDRAWVYVRVWQKSRSIEATDAATRNLHVPGAEL